MTTDEKIDLILSKLDTMDKRLDKIESKLDTLEHSSYLLENDIAPKVQVLLEHHTDLAKNVLVAKGIEERVGMLEFEVKAIKAVMSKSA